MNDSSSSKPVIVPFGQAPKMDSTPEISLPVKLDQILASENIDAKRAVTVMIDAAHRKMLRDPCCPVRVK